MPSNERPTWWSGPGDTAEVSQVLRLANESLIPVVPFGAGTGVMGGAVPIRGGIVLDMQRLDRALAVDPVGLTAEVEAGAVLGDVERCLAEQGLMLGHDPYSVPIATIAGTISTNGVGYRASAYGPMGDQVVGLEAVLPDGRVMTTRAVPMYSSGPNLNHLFIGTEGSFGVITKATIKVFRLPEAQAFCAVSFDSFTEGFNAVVEMVGLGIKPSLLDLTEEEDGVVLHLLFEGFREGVEAQHQRGLMVCASEGGRHLGPEPTMDYWEVRRDSAENYKNSRLGQTAQRPLEPLVQPSRVRLPAHGLARIPRAGLSPPSRRHHSRRRYQVGGIRYLEPPRIILHAGGARVRGSSRRQRTAWARTVDEVLQLAQDMGGVMEYCHGVGVKLNHLLAREMGTGHDVLQSMKRLLDPNNIMNPGKLGPACLIRDAMRNPVPSRDLG